MSKRMIKFSAVCLSFTLSILSFQQVAFCQDQPEKLVTNLKKGEKSPYDGVLLSVQLAAEIKNNCSPEIIQKRQDAAVQEAVSLCKSAAQKDSVIFTEKLQAQEAKYEKIIAAKDIEIQTLRDKLRPPAWYESPKVWFTVGLVAGAGTVVYIMR